MRGGAVRNRGMGGGSGGMESVVTRERSYNVSFDYFNYFNIANIVDWVKAIGSRIIYEPHFKRHVLYVLPIQDAFGKVTAVPVGGTGTIPHYLRTIGALFGGPWARDR